MLNPTGFWVAVRGELIIILPGEEHKASIVGVMKKPCLFWFFLLQCHGDNCC